MGRNRVRGRLARLGGRGIALAALALPVTGAAQPSFESAWGVEGSVLVRAERERTSGHRTAWEFDLRWSETPAGLVRFSLESPRVHSLDGQRVRGEDMRMQAAVVEAVERLTPSWLVDREGDFAGIDSTVADADSVLTTVEAGSRFEPDARRELLELLRLPDTLALARSRPEDLWRTWWQSWQTIVLEEGTIVQREDPAENGSRSSEVLRVDQIYLERGRARAVLRRTQEIELQPPGGATEPTTAIAESRALVDAQTRRPLTVNERSARTIRGADGSTREIFRESVYVFTWDRLPERRDQ